MKLALNFDEITTAASHWRKYLAYARARDHYIRVTIGANRYLNDRSVPILSGRASAVAAG